jgi:hypothetical protein
MKFVFVGFQYCIFTIPFYLSDCLLMYTKIDFSFSNNLVDYLAPDG